MRFGFITVPGHYEYRHNLRRFWSLARPVVTLNHPNASVADEVLLTERKQPAYMATSVGETSVLPLGDDYGAAAITTRRYDANPVIEHRPLSVADRDQAMADEVASAANRGFAHKIFFYDMRRLFGGILAILFTASLNVAPSLGSDLLGEGYKGNTIQRTMRMESQYRSLRPEIDKLYSHLLTKLVDRDMLAALRQSQLSWRNYVEAQCKPEGSLVAGTGSSIIIPDCKKKMYDARLAYLKSVESHLNEL